MAQSGPLSRGLAATPHSATSANDPGSESETRSSAELMCSCIEYNYRSIDSILN